MRKLVLVLLVMTMIALPMSASAANRFSATSQFGGWTMTSTPGCNTANNNANCTTGNCPSATRNSARCSSANCPSTGCTGRNCANNPSCAGANCGSTNSCVSGSCGTSNNNAGNCTTGNRTTGNRTTGNCTTGNCPKPTRKPGRDTTGNTNNAGNASGASMSSAAAEVVRQVNMDRAKAGLNPLSVDSELTAAACVRAQEIVASFSHTRPNGQRGLSASAKARGENIAKGQQNADKVMAAWMSSSGHRANILRASFSSIGVCAYQVNGVMYWVQLFA